MYEGEFDHGQAVGIGFLNNNDGSSLYEGRDRYVIREAMMNDFYKKRKTLGKFESKTYFERPFHPDE